MIIFVLVEHIFCLVGSAAKPVRVVVSNLPHIIKMWQNVTVFQTFWISVFQIHEDQMLSSDFKCV